MTRTDTLLNPLCAIISFSQTHLVASAKSSVKLYSVEGFNDKQNISNVRKVGIVLRHAVPRAAHKAAKNAKHKIKEMFTTCITASSSRDAQIVTNSDAPSRASDGTSNQKPGDSYDPTSEERLTKTIQQRTVEVALKPKDGIHTTVAPGSPLSEITDDRSEVEQQAASKERNYTIKNRPFSIIEYTSDGSNNRRRDVVLKWRECGLTRIKIFAICDPFGSSGERVNRVIVGTDGRMDGCEKDFTGDLNIGPDVCDCGLRVKY